MNTSIDSLLAEAIHDLSEMETLDIKSEDETDDMSDVWADFPEDIQLVDLLSSTDVLTRGVIRIGHANRDEGIYVGRPSVFGNPFHADKYGRDGCILAFERFLRLALREVWPPIARATHQLAARVKAGENIVLTCWCDQLRDCHAVVIRRAIYELASGS